jgi:small-conductance mechanosensitive channel
MTGTLLRSVIDLTFLTLGAVALVTALRLIAFLFRVLPAPARVRESLRRFAPILGLTVLVAYVASGVAWLLARQNQFATVLLCLVAVLVVFAWAPLYDLICGVAFRFGQWCHEGDMVKVGDIEGRVVSIGMRSIVIQTRQGDEAVVPYSRVTRHTLRRTQSVSGAHVHAFVIEAPAGASFSALKQDVIRAAMRCHWASVVHPSKVERREGDTIEVSIYALDADHSLEVEAAVRAAIHERNADALFRS